MGKIRNRLPQVERDSVVQKLLNKQRTLEQLSKEYKVPEYYISRWKKDYLSRHVELEKSIPTFTSEQPNQITPFTAKSERVMVDLLLDKISEMTAEIKRLQAIEAAYNARIAENNKR